jgi:hypothetical protein
MRWTRNQAERPSNHREGTGMYATFSYDIGSGSHPNEEVLERIMEKFDALPNGAERRRCHLLGDTFICEVANLDDFEATNLRLARLRTELGEQFSYTFSLHSRNAPLKIRGPHNAPLAKQIIEA